jgi:1-phosphofructokinase family hexose kinase
VIKALGGLTTALGPLGGPEGEEFKKLLHAENIYIWSVNTQSRTRENITILSKNKNHQTRFNLKGESLSPAEYREFLKLVDQLAGNADVFVISGSTPPGVSDDAYFKIIKMIQAANPHCKIFLDADGGSFKKGIKAVPYLIKPNIHELERLVGKSIRSSKGIIQAVKTIQKKFPIPYVVVSLGAKGVLGFERGGAVYSITPPDVKVVTTLGAGDAMLAGIATILRNSDDFQEALRYGVAVSNAKIQCHRFCEIKMSTVKMLLRKIKIKKVVA